MEVIAMRLVRLRAQYGAEDPAGDGMDRPLELHPLVVPGWRLSARCGSK